jgi:threonine synthase
VPDCTSGPKRNQIEAYGAQLVSIPGERARAAEAVRQQADKGIVYASHAYLPLGLLGIATIAFELFEELGDAIVNVIMPIGHGGLMLGVMRGFDSLMAAGYISRLPKFIGVQAELCAPVANILDGKSSSIGLSHTTIAEGVRVTDPVRGKEIVNYLKRLKGIILRIKEEQIIASYKDLAKRGIHVEPTSAMVWAALKQLPDEMSGTTVLIQTGSGLKFIPG